MTRKRTIIGYTKDNVRLVSTRINEDVRLNSKCYKKIFNVKYGIIRLYPIRYRVYE